LALKLIHVAFHAIKAVEQWPQIAILRPSRPDRQ
jgi:hypothetical protein